ncbi:hypothetical protein LJC47_00680 [Desulfosarcina sp. OttesenSCG-928-B08]|nr:hypothetical protein [Desulfosarcina sp. OttesenSCG-928-B08]
MSDRKSKPATFDAMVKFFLQKYNLPTKRDIERINDRLDRLETLLRSGVSGTRTPPVRRGGRRPAEKTDRRASSSATEVVFNLIRQSKTPIPLTTIREQTGFDDKKLRNIIYRLNQMGKIIRINRGSYKAAE